MESKDLKLDVLPPDEHPVGIYLGLVIGGIVLGIGTFVLSKEILITFAKEGIKLDTMMVFRILLMLATAYSSFACFLGLYRMVDLQRMMVRKVDEGFKDFVMYARPLVEEVIKQRIVGERISEKLEMLAKKEALMKDGSMSMMGQYAEANSLKPSRWGEFLLMVALLTGVSVGLFIYLDSHPWKLVPYSVIFLSLAWWFLLTKYFDLFGDWRSYLIPAIFILLMPSSSIILRAYMQPYEVLYVVFLTMFFYVLVMYTHFNYLATGKRPGLLSKIPSGLEGLSSIGTQSEDVHGGGEIEGYDRFSDPIYGVKEVAKRFHERSRRREGSEDKKEMHPKIKKLFPPEKSK